MASLKCLSLNWPVFYFPPDALMARPWVAALALARSRL